MSLCADDYVSHVKCKLHSDFGKQKLEDISIEKLTANMPELFHASHGGWKEYYCQRLELGVTSHDIISPLQNKNTRSRCTRNITVL